MSKPKIRFKGYEEDWEQRKFGNVTELKSASRVHKEEWTTSGVPFYRSSDVMAAINGTENEKVYISEALYEKLSSISGKLEAGDVLVTGGGSVGKPYIVPNNEPLYTKDADLLWIKNQGKFHPYFLYEFFFTPTFRSYLSSISHVGTIAHYTITQLSETPICLPSVGEQQKIGDYFYNIDHLITLHQRKCEETKKLKKYMLQKMFPQNGKRVPEIRFVGFTEDWEQRKLKETIEYIVDNRGKNPDYYCSEGIPVIDNFMIRNSLYPDLNTATRFIDENLYQNFIRKYNEEDDILLTLVGNGIGNITLFPKDKAVIIQNTLGFRAKEDKKFLFFLLMANNEALVKLDRGMAQPSIRQDEILDLDIYVPSNSEQTQIGEYFTYLDNLITLHQRKYEELQKIKKFMLQNMFI